MNYFRCRVADISIAKTPVLNRVFSEKNFKRKLNSTRNNTGYLVKFDSRNPNFSREDKKLWGKGLPLYVWRLSLKAPWGIFKIHLVPCRPFGIDGLLSDEAMAPVLCMLVDPVHLALFNSVLLIVVVRDNSVIGSTVREGVRSIISESYKTKHGAWVEVIKVCLTCSSYHRSFHKRGCCHTYRSPGSLWRSRYWGTHLSSFWMEDNKLYLKLLNQKSRISVSYTIGFLIFNVGLANNLRCWTHTCFSQFHSGTLYHSTESSLWSQRTF